MLPNKANIRRNVAGKAHWWGRYQNRAATSGSWGQHQIFVTPRPRALLCTMTCHPHKEKATALTRCARAIPIHWEISDRSLCTMEWSKSGLPVMLGTVHYYKMWAQLLVPILWTVEFTTSLSGPVHWDSFYRQSGHLFCI
jgi:hypothetical protein